MSNMYYEREPQSASREVACVFSYHGNRLTFQTDAGVFSKGELDQGTRLLLDALPELTGEVLDLGCGWGAIGIAVKKAFPPEFINRVDEQVYFNSLTRENIEAIIDIELKDVRKRALESGYTLTVTKAAKPPMTPDAISPFLPVIASSNFSLM